MHSTTKNTEILFSSLLYPQCLQQSQKHSCCCCCCCCCVTSVVSDSKRPHRLQSTRLLCPWDFPGKSTGVGCHCLLRRYIASTQKWKGRRGLWIFKLASPFWKHTLISQNPKFSSETHSKGFLLSEAPLEAPGWVGAFSGLPWCPCVVSPIRTLTLLLLPLHLGPGLSLSRLWTL